MWFFPNREQTTLELLPLRVINGSIYQCSVFWLLPRYPCCKTLVCYFIWGCCSFWDSAFRGPTLRGHVTLKSRSRSLKLGQLEYFIQGYLYPKYQSDPRKKWVWIIIIIIIIPITIVSPCLHGEPNNTDRQKKTLDFYFPDSSKEFLPLSSHYLPSVRS